MEKQIESQPKKSIWRWSKWVLLVVLILAVGIMTIGYFSKRNSKQSDEQKPNPATDLSDHQYLEYFPVRFEDFVQPPKMYGLWPYGIKGKDKNDHNEGHPGWDFELAKGSKVYAVSDLNINQIHEGDKSTENLTPQVIESTAKVNNQNIHITYHSVVNLDPSVKEGAIIKAGQPLAEAGYPLSNNSAMLHFGVFPPNDSVGSCPTEFFSSQAKAVLDRIVSNSLDVSTGKPFQSACIGKINKDLYYQNYPDRIKELGGSERWE